MKKWSLLFFVVVAMPSFGQPISTLLLKHWTKTEIRKKDNSKLYDDAWKKANFDFNFFSKDSVQVIAGGKANNYYYHLQDSTVNFNKLTFNIRKITDVALVLEQADVADDALKFYYVPKNLEDLTYRPEGYVSKSGETVYIMIPGKIEPVLKNKTMNGMDFIADKFAFPQYKKGGFVVRFVVTNLGDVKGVKMVASSNDHYNDKLVESVYQTQGRWLPAEYLGKKVNTEVEYNFNLGYTDNGVDAGATDSLKYSDMYYTYGNDYFEVQSYKQAAQYYKKAIDYNPMNINAYYQRAACNIYLRNRDEACADFKQLVILEQNKAKNLLEKYCK